MLNTNHLPSTLWLLAARILFASLFLQDAIFNKIIHHDQSLSLMSSINVPYPMVCLIAVASFEIVASIMLVFNRHTRIVCVIFALFCIAVSLMFHRFWTYQALDAVQNQLNHFMKNLCIAGGAMYMARYGT